MSGSFFRRAGLIAAAFLVLGASAWAQQNPRTTGREDTSGFAITGGYGYEYAGVGVAGEYYQELGGASIGLLLGVGYFPAMSIGGVTTDSSVGFGVGGRLAIGGSSRFVLDVQYGLAGEAAMISGGTRITSSMWGVTGAVGYQFVGSGGFMLLGTIGYTSFVGAPLWTTFLMGSGVVTLNLGLGYKFS